MSTQHPNGVLGRARQWEALVAFAAPPVFALAGAIAVAGALRAGDGGGGITSLIITSASIGVVFACCVAVRLFRVAPSGSAIEATHGQDLETWANFTEDEPFANLVRAILWRWKEGRNADGLETDDLFENLLHILTAGPRAIRGVARPMVILGFLGTCIALPSYLSETVETLKGIETVGPEVLQQLSGALDMLPGAFWSTVAGLVAGPLVLWSMANALEAYATRTVLRFREIVHSYVIPEMRVQRRER